MDNVQKILITGASGLLGANLVRHYAPRSECTGWYASNPITIDGAKLERIDITDHESVSIALARIHPDLIIHCAAATNVEWCEQNPRVAKAINEEATAFLADQAAQFDSKFVFISTDSVFGGKKERYSESDRPNPLNSYATGKVRTESLVASANSDALIIRSYFYGYSPSGTRSLLEWVLVRALSGEEVPGFTDSYFSPISVQDFARALDIALAEGTSGLLHLGSSDRISKYEFARIVMEIYDWDMSLLKPITVDDAGLKADRPRDTSLNVDLLEKIWGKSVPTVADGIKRLASEPNPFH
jgi:dTDP-4-dehydrorhamnose reductase